MTSILLITSACDGRNQMLAAAVPIDFPWHAIVRSVLTLSFPCRVPLLNILSVYAVILLPMAAFLWAYRLNRVIAMLASFSLYLFTQFSPVEALFGCAHADTWCFNPLSWQFLFAIGIACGVTSFAPLDYRKARCPALSVALVVIVAGVLSTKAIGVSMPLLRWEESLRDVAWLTDKSRLAPLRLIHFLAVATLLRLVFWRTWEDSGVLTRPLVQLGQTSLFTYSSGVVLTFASCIATANLGTSPWVILLIHADLFFASLLLARGWRWVLSGGPSRCLR